MSCTVCAAPCALGCPCCEEPFCSERCQHSWHAALGIDNSEFVSDDGDDDDYIGNDSAEMIGGPFRGGRGGRGGFGGRGGRGGFGGRGGRGGGLRGGRGGGWGWRGRGGWRGGWGGGRWGWRGLGWRGWGRGWGFRGWGLRGLGYWLSPWAFLTGAYLGALPYGWAYTPGYGYALPGFNGYLQDYQMRMVLASLAAQGYNPQAYLSSQSALPPSEAELAAMRAAAIEAQSMPREAFEEQAAAGAV